MMVHLESLIPKSSEKENLLYYMIYFIWFVVYIHTAGVYVDKLLSKLLFTHHRIKNEVNMMVYNQSFTWNYLKEENSLFQRSIFIIWARFTLLMVHMDKVITKQLPTECCAKKEVNMMLHLESLVPKSSKEENFLSHVIYFIWFVVYVHTAGV